MFELIAQQPQNLGDPLRGIGPLGLQGQDASGAFGIFTNLISKAIGLMTIIAFIWFTFLLISGAYGVMSSGGDKGAAETARKRISSGITGIVIVIAAIFVVRIIATLLGVQDALNPASILNF